MCNYFDLCKNFVVMGLIFFGVFLFVGMFVFLIAGVFVYIDIYGVSLDGFGYLFGFNIVVMIVLIMINGCFVKKIGLYNMLCFVFFL